MISALIIALIITIIVVIIICIFLYIKLRAQIKQKENSSQKDKKLIETIFGNVDTYLVLIDRSFVVHENNYYIVTHTEDTHEEKLIGELLKCKNGLDAGRCGTHLLCKQCKVRKAITESFDTLTDFKGLESPMRLYLSEKKDDFVDCEIKLSGSIVYLNNKHYMLLTIYDETQYKKKMLELDAAKQTAENLAFDKGRLISSISETIRIPVTSVIGFSELFMSEKQSEKRAEYIKLIKDNDELLKQILNDFSDLSMLKPENIKSELEKCDVRDILDEVKTIGEYFINHQGSIIAISTMVPANNRPINIDRRHAFNLLLGVVCKAILRMTEGIITIGYKIKEKDVYLYVSDTDDGTFQNEYLEKLKNGKPSRIDLGLYIFTSIVESLNGSIGVISKDEGTPTLWFTLPLINEDID